MNAVQMLMEDHRKVKGLFDSLRQVDAYEDKYRIFREVREELTTHSRIEETVFYPAFSSVEGMKELVERSFADHQEVKDLLEEIEDSDSEEFDVLCDELIESVDMHVATEEEELFPLAQKALTPEQMGLLGDRMAELRESRSKGGKAAAA